MRSRLGSLVILSVCLVWILTVHLAYFLTQDEDVIVRLGWTWRGSPVHLLIIAFLILQSFVLPLGLALGFMGLRLEGHPFWFRGLLVGLMIGICANTEFLAVPYCGGYLSLPVFILVHVLSVVPGERASFVHMLLAGNLLFWTALGIGAWCIGYMKR